MYTNILTMAPMAPCVGCVIFILRVHVYAHTAITITNIIPITINTTTSNSTFSNSITERCKRTNVYKLLELKQQKKHKLGITSGETCLLCCDINKSVVIRYKKKKIHTCKPTELLQCNSRTTLLPTQTSRYVDNHDDVGR